MGIALIGLSVLVAGFYAASILLVWFLYGGIPSGWWLSPLFLLFPPYWLTPLAIPSLMIILVSSYTARMIVWKAYPPPPKAQASTIIPASWVFARIWKKMRPRLLPIVLVTLAISFYALTFTMDYTAVQTIRIEMNVASRHSSLNPPQANFTIFFYINSPQPSTEVTKLLGTRFSLAVDSLTAGTITWPTEMWIGGWNGRDNGDYLQFNITGPNATTILQHNPNTLIITAQFLAQGYLYQQEVTKSIRISSYNQTSYSF